jgi:galactokinase
MAEMEVFVPGRLCILGEHSDWMGEFRDVNPTVSYGMTVVCATNEGLYARCRGSTPGRLTFSFTLPDG